MDTSGDYRPLQFRQPTYLLRGILLVVLLMCPLAGHAQDNRTLVIEAIDIEGNSKTRPQVIDNYLGVQPGHSITRQDVEHIRQRLLNTNFFKDVQVLLLPGSERGKARLRLQVQERRGPYFSFRSGYNELDGWYISPLGLHFDNFLGRGNILGGEIIAGDRIVGLQIDYIRPFFLGSEYDFQFRLFAFGREFLHFSDGIRDIQNVPTGGAMFRLAGNSGLARFFSIAYIAQNVNADSFFVARDGNEPQRVPEYLERVAGLNEIRRFVLTAKVDTRDNQLYPNRGWWGSVSYDQSSKQLRSFADFYRFTIDVRRYQPVNRQMILALRTQYGNVSEVAPFYEKFYLGGPNSLRGYRDRSLTPEGYAASKVLASAELRFPLSARMDDPDRFTGVLFFDSGEVWSEPGTFQSSRLKSGYGAGIRVKLPVAGVLRLDLAYPSVNSGNYQLHLSLGQTF